MASSTLPGERRWASVRRGGMTVLGKVAVPKPLNLPSQKLENHGLDPTVEIVPKGSLSWGSRPSSSTSNPWGSSAISPKADGGSGSPSHCSGRPSSGGGLSRPSTTGSDILHESAASAWGPNSRPSSASGVLTTNHLSPTSSRPRSAETRPGSSHLSRFAEPASDSSVAWGPNTTAEKLLMPSRDRDFSLSSGDFPTLGSEKEKAGKSGEPHDHHSNVRPSSASSGTSPAQERNTVSQADNKNGTVNTLTREGPPHAEDGVYPSPPQYINPNIPPQHFNAWRGPPMNAPAGVWYSGGPGGPPYPPVPHGGFPMEPFPYYPPQVPPPLANPQPGPPPRGHHPNNRDFYRPQMTDAFIHPGMAVRPGFYPGPVPYDGYYGPPMGYNPNERDIPFMGMAPGPPVYMYPTQNSSEPSDAQFRAAGRGSTANMPVSEQLGSVCPDEARGPYKVFKKRENEWDADVEEEDRGPTTADFMFSEKDHQPRPSSRNIDPQSNDRKKEDGPSRRNTFVENSSSRKLGDQGHSSDSGKSKAFDDSWRKRSEIGLNSFPEGSRALSDKPTDSNLIQKIEGLNAKVRVSDTKEDSSSVSLREEQKNRLLVNLNVNSSAIEGSSSCSDGDLSLPSHDPRVSTGDDIFKSTSGSAPQFSRQVHHGVQSRVGHHNRGRLNNEDPDGLRKQPPFLGSESAVAVSNQNVGHTTTFQVPDRYTSMKSAEKSEIKSSGEYSTPMFDSNNGEAQRAKMKELAKQRAIQLQKEEEERIREQKAKALAKLEELNRRTLAADGAVENVDKAVGSVPVQVAVDGSHIPPEPAIATSKNQALSSDLDAKHRAFSQIKKSNTSEVDQSATLTRESHLEKPKNADQEPVVSQGQSLHSKHNNSDAPANENKSAPLVNDGGISKMKHAGHRQKQSFEVEKSLTGKSILIGTNEMLIGNVAVSTEAVPSLMSSLPNNSNISPESTTHQISKINHSSKNEHRRDTASLPATASSSSSVPKEANLAKVSTDSEKTKSPQIELDHKDAMQPKLEPNSSLPSEEAHGRANNQYKPQHSRGTPRSTQANRSTDRSHGSEAVMWAPVRVHNKADHGDETNEGHPGKRNNKAQNNLKNRRAEMERYVPKPVAKVLAQQENIHQPDAKSTPEEVRDREEELADNKLNKHVKPHGAWRQRGRTDLHGKQSFQQGSVSNSNSSNYQKPMSQNEASNPIATETNINHEWDPSDGWNMPEYPPPEATPVTSIMKDQGGVTGKGRRQIYKAQRSIVNNHDVDHKNVSGAEVDINQTERPVSSKENRSSHWQPKSPALIGSQNTSSEVKKLTPKIQPQESVAKYKNAQERRPSSSKARTHPLNQGPDDVEDEAHLGFRKNGGQNNLSGGQDNRHQHNSTVNFEGQRQNPRFEYLPVGSNNNSNSRFNNSDAPTDVSRTNAPRYRERGSGQSRRGGGNFYGRQSGAV